MSTDSNEMTILANDVQVFDQNEWLRFRARLEEVFPIGVKDSSIIYFLPEPLIEAFNKRAPGIISERELDLEFELGQLLNKHHAIGVDGSKLVRSTLFQRPPPPVVSLEEVRALGWDQFGLDGDSANRLIQTADQRAEFFRDQLAAYAGWLITNPVFLKEVKELQLADNRLATQDTPGAFEAEYSQINTFLVRWQLGAMSSWDLPLPQGPNLSGIEFPRPRERGVQSVQIDLPLTTRLPSQFPIRDVVAEIRKQETPAHLTGWEETLSTESSRGLGMERFRNMLHLRFFQGIVLESRYRGRFTGNLEALDRAFGVYLGLSAESARQLRLEVSRRLRSS